MTDWVLPEMSGKLNFWQICAIFGIFINTFHSFAANSVCYGTSKNPNAKNIPIDFKVFTKTLVSGTISSITSKKHLLGLVFWHTWMICVRWQQPEVLHTCYRLYRDPGPPSKFFLKSLGKPKLAFITSTIFNLYLTKQF